MNISDQLKIIKFRQKIEAKNINGRTKFKYWMFNLEILNNKRKRQTDYNELFTIVTPKIVSAKIVDTVWTFDVIRGFLSIVVGNLGRWDA